MDLKEENEEFLDRINMLENILKVDPKDDQSSEFSDEKNII